MQVYVGSDHAGFPLKTIIVSWLKDQEGIQLEDVGTHSTESCDYPTIAHDLAARIVDCGDGALGVLVCGTGLGISMAANRHPGIRAAVCTDSFSARMARAHNNANVLCLGQRVVGSGLALEILNTFLSGTFEGGRHGRRVELIEPV